MTMTVANPPTPSQEQVSNKSLGDPNSRYALVCYFKNPYQHRSPKPLRDYRFTFYSKQWHWKEYLPKTAKARLENLVRKKHQSGTLNYAILYLNLNRGHLVNAYLAEALSPPLFTKTRHGGRWHYTSQKPGYAPVENLQIWNFHPRYGFRTALPPVPDEQLIFSPTLTDASATTKYFYHLQQLGIALEQGRALCRYLGRGSAASFSD